MKSQISKTLILALGNPILSDDAVGWEVADRLAACLPDEAFDIIKETGATLDLLSRFEGYDRLIIIDAIKLGSVPVGTVHKFTLDELNSTIRRSSAHDINFATAFSMGKQLGYDIPNDVRIYAIEVKELNRFSEGCTPEIKSKLDCITQQITSQLHETACLRSDRI